MVAFQSAMCTQLAQIHGASRDFHLATSMMLHSGDGSNNNVLVSAADIKSIYEDTKPDGEIAEF